MIFEGRKAVSKINIPIETLFCQYLVSLTSESF